jgi:hypothetical protein
VCLRFARRLDVQIGERQQYAAEAVEMGARSTAVNSAWQGTDGFIFRRSDGWPVVRTPNKNGLPVISDKRLLKDFCR